MPDLIIDSFYSHMQNVNLNTYGILDQNNMIHTLGTDSKIIGRIFEMLIQPILEDIAQENNFLLRTPSSQTVYPDFIMMEQEESDKKIAIDVKTTYVTNEDSQIKFTLGAFASYMRNNTKNIEYKYTDYASHYVIGFIYKRNDSAQDSRVVPHTDRDSIICPYFDVKYFIQEKYKIAGDKPGSGNTENIGSFATKNFMELKNGEGPFSSLGEDIYNLYWMYYPQYRSQVKNSRDLRSFVAWPLQQEELPDLLYDYDKNLIRQQLEEWQNNHSS